MLLNPKIITSIYYGKKLMSPSHPRVASSISPSIFFIILLPFYFLVVQPLDLSSTPMRCIGIIYDIKTLLQVLLK